MIKVDPYFFDDSDVEKIETIDGDIFLSISKLAEEEDGYEIYKLSILGLERIVINEKEACELKMLRDTGEIFYTLQETPNILVLTIDWQNYGFENHGEESLCNNYEFKAKEFKLELLGKEPI